MKTLSVFRHAKAKNPDKYESDIERPLARRGHKDAVLMTKILAGLNLPVDWIISSPAVRTRETTEHLLNGLDNTPQVMWNDAVYLAYPNTLLSILKKIPREVNHVVLVGHNPGMEELVSGLCAGAIERLNVRMSTAALAHINLEIFWWNQIRWGCGQLQFLATPRVMKS